MPKKVSYQESSGGVYFKPEAGGYPAILVGIMELGTEMRSFQGGEPKPIEEIRLVFEIEASQEVYDTEKGEGTGEYEDKIGLIGMNCAPIVSDKSKLGKVIANIYDVKSVEEIKNFSLEKLLGQKCYINIEMKGKEKNYETITSVSALNKKMEKLLHEQARKNFYFGMEDVDDFDEDLMKDQEALKPWDIKRIAESPEYKELCKSLGIEVPETFEEQEENMKKEAEERKAKQTKKESKEEEITSEDIDDMFGDEELPNEEPETTKKARAKAKKVEDEELDDDL